MGAGGGDSAGDGTVSIANGPITGNAIGVLAESGGSVDMHGAVVTNSTRAGVKASDSGSVLIADGTDVTGNQGDGVTATTGGRVVFSDGTVENNTGNGISLSGGSTLATGQPVIRSNGGDGIHLKDTSVAQLGPPDQITGNGGWGIFCAGPPSVAMTEGGPGTVSGNASGQNNCPSA